MNLLIQKLETALKETLPGSYAHALMSPMGRGDTEEYLTNTKVPVRTSAVMIVLFEENEVCKMVLIRRPSYDGVHSGQISFPGGKYEESDKDYMATALRETHEEIGVFANQIKVLGALSRIYIPPSNFLVYPFIGYCEKTPVFQPDKKEVDQLIFPAIDILLNEDIRKEGSFASGGKNNWQIKAPYYEIENEKVWGATAIILSEFKIILSRIKAE